MMEIAIPCLEIQMVDRDMIIANNYNPNFVSADKMQYLKQSIIDNGFCYPIITIWDKEQEKYVIIDGFHRFAMCQKKWLDIKKIPIIVLVHEMKERMVATMQFNKARGIHQVDLEADIIRKLVEQGMQEDDVAIHLGIDVDTVYRYKQLTGFAELFKNIDYSKSWRMENDDESDNM